MKFFTTKNLINSRQARGHGIPNKEQESLSCPNYRTEEEYFEEYEPCLLSFGLACVCKCRGCDSKYPL